MKNVVLHRPVPVASGQCVCGGGGGGGGKGGGRAGGGRKGQCRISLLVMNRFSLTNLAIQSFLTKELIIQNISTIYQSFT